MKLIKKGNKLDKVWRGDCLRCGSGFEANHSEVENKIHSDQRDGEWVVETCTVCGSAFHLYPVK